MATEANTQSFWEHLDVLRAAIIKIVAVAVVFGIVVFFFKLDTFIFQHLLVVVTYFSLV